MCCMEHRIPCKFIQRILEDSFCNYLYYFIRVISIIILFSNRILMALFAISAKFQASSTNLKEAVSNDSPAYDYDNTQDHMENSRTLFKRDSILESVYGDFKKKESQTELVKKNGIQSIKCPLVSPIRPSRKKKKTKSAIKDFRDYDKGNSNDLEKNMSKTIFKLMKEILLDKENRVKKKKTGKMSIRKTIYNDEDVQSSSLTKGNKVRKLDKPINFIKLRAWYNLNEVKGKRDSGEVQEQRVVQRFLNIHDSQSELENFDFYDFQTKWYSIHPRSKVAFTIATIKEMTVFIGAVFFPLELVYYDKYSVPTVFTHVTLELVFIITYLLGFLIGFEEKRNKQINFNLSSILNNNINSQNVLWVYYEQLVILFNHITYQILSSIIKNDKMFFDVFIMSKFLLFMNLNEWVILNPILKTLNDIMLKYSSQGKNQGSIILTLSKILACLKVLAYYLIFIHTASCMWIYIYKYSENSSSNDNWVYYLGYYSYDFDQLYVASFYFCLTTFVSVGYGDIHPFTQRERIFGIIFMFLGVLFYSFLISLISSLVVRDESKRAVFLEKKKVLDEINSETKLGEELYSRINNSLAHSTQSSNNDKLMLVENLPSNLKDNILYAIHNRMINALNYFNKVSKNFILFTCSYLKIHLYDRNYKILSPGQKIFEMIFILKGYVNLYLSERQELLKLTVFKEGEHFLDNYLESQEQISPYSILTKASFNEIVSLSKDNYNLLKNSFPSTVESRLKETKLRYQIIDRLTESARYYFKKYGTMQNFSEKWQKKVKSELEKDLQIYESEDEGDSQNLEGQSSLIKSPKPKMRSTARILIISDKKSKADYSKIHDSKNKKPKNLNIKAIIGAIKATKKLKSTDLTSKRFREDYFKTHTHDSGILETSKLATSQNDLNTSIIKNFVKSSKVGEFRKNLNRKFKDEIEHIVFHNNVLQNSAQNTSNSIIKGYRFVNCIQEEGYCLDKSSLAKESNSGITYCKELRPTSKQFLIQLSKTPNHKKSKINNLKLSNQQAFRLLLKDIKIADKSTSTPDKHSNVFEFEDTSNLKLISDNYLDKDEPPNRRLIDFTISSEELEPSFQGSFNSISVGDCLAKSINNFNYEENANK